MALVALLLDRCTAWAQPQTDNVLEEHSGASWTRQPIRPLVYEKPPAGLSTPGVLMPHAGDYVSSERNYYEIVYMPLQTRIYVYDRKLRPATSKEVQAHMTVRPASQAGEQKVAFQYVPQPPGSTEQDYLTANFDAGPLQGSDVSISFELSRLTETAVLSPYYAHFNIRPYIAKASVIPADKDAIDRQRICPVTGAPLGSRGAVVKIYVAEFPLFLSGEDCIGAVAQSPQRYVPQAPRRRYSIRRVLPFGSLASVFQARPEPVLPGGKLGSFFFRQRHQEPLAGGLDSSNCIMQSLNLSQSAHPSHCVHIALGGTGFTARSAQSAFSAGPISCNSDGDLPWAWQMR